MRVTFLLPHYGWHASGGFRVVYTYAGLLAERGHEVSVVHPRRLPAGGWQRARGVLQHARRAATRVRDIVLRPRLGWVEIDPRVRLLYAPAITDAAVPDADAVIATWWSTAEAALELSAGKGRRFHLIQGYEVWNGAEDRVHAVWRAPLHKIFIARWLLDRAIELGVDRSITTLIPNAIDHATFRSTNPIEARGPCVAMLYSGESYKGGALGLEMLRRARQRVPGLTARLFGAGRAPPALPDWMTYTRAATPRQLAEQVYGMSAVYLCPSLSEGWHLPPAEAMACGCALVSSDIGGVADYATDGDTAALYPAGDVAQGTDRLVRLLTDDAARIALARRGRERIAQFSWERSADRLIAVLEQRPIER